MHKIDPQTLETKEKVRANYDLKMYKVCLYGERAEAEMRQLLCLGGLE